MAAMSHRRVFAFLFWILMMSGTAMAAETAPEPAAFPASLGGDCGDAACPDTLHEPHRFIFVTREAFPINTALLTGRAKDELQRMLLELESFGVVEQVNVVGHADPSGPEQFNRWIAEKRAIRVRNHLAQSGLDPRKLNVRSAGSTEPLPGAIEPSAHRRIEIEVTVRAFP